MPPDDHVIKRRHCIFFHRIGLWTCIALLFLMEITIAASIMEPVASAVMQVEASAAFSSGVVLELTHENRALCLTHHHPELATS